MATLAVGMFIAANPMSAMMASILMMGAGMLDQKLFGKTTEFKQEGPRLDDIKLQASTYGSAIPQVYGTVRIAGNVIWGTNFVEHVKTETSSSGGKGGGGGGSSTTTTTYSYSVSYAVAICRGPIVRVVRAWADGTEIDLTRVSYTVYTGSESQMPDSFIEGLEGAGNVPAYRGIAYIVFQNFYVDDYGRRIPNLTFEVESATTNLQAITEQISTAAGVDPADIDASDLSDVEIPGYFVSGEKTFRSRFEQLQTVYVFDGIEYNGQVLFQKRDITTATAIDEDDLNAYEAGTEKPLEPYKITRKHDLDLLKKLTIKYISADKDYQQGTMTAFRQATICKNDKTIELDFVLTDSQAKELAETRLYEIWVNRSSYEFTLPLKYLHLRPGMTISLPNGNRVSWMVVEKTTFGKPGLVKIQAVDIGKTTYRVATRHIDGEIMPGVVDPPTSVDIEFLDIPRLPTDTLADDQHIYVAARADVFYGANIYRSLDGGTTYRPLLTSLAKATMGASTTELADGQTNTFDWKNSVDVLLSSGTLESRPAVDVLNGFNVAVLGNEVIQFQTATLIATDTYRLSGLLRGRLGTEHETVNHAIGDRFILLNDRIGSMPLLSSDWYADRVYRVGQVTRAVTDGTYEDHTFQGQGVVAKPRSVCHIKGVRDNSSNLTIEWKRRTRGDGTWKDFVDAPLSETFEQYEIEIMSGTTVKRTLTATSQSVSYTAAQQTTDFGSAQSSIDVKIYQMSEIKGRGQVREATI
jgi:hypothetical protein